jgi:hypothetical protein
MEEWDLKWIWKGTGDMAERRISISWVGGVRINLSGNFLLTSGEGLLR